MARITVEDCLEHIPNRFDLVLVASKRARQLSHGKEAHVPWDNDKPTVVALREIAAAAVDGSILSEASPEEQREEALDEQELRERLRQELQQELQQELHQDVQQDLQQDFQQDAEQE